MFQTDLPLLQPKQPPYVPSNSSQFSYQNFLTLPPSINYTKFLLFTLLPIYSWFIINIIILRISTYYQFRHEIPIIRNIEIEKNRKNQPNKLRLIDGLYNNKFQHKPVYSQCILLRKCILFTFALTHLICFTIKIYIAAPKPHYNTTMELGSFPSLFAADCLSVNCLLFILMLSSFNHLQTIHTKSKTAANSDGLESPAHRDSDKVSLSYINNHTLNGFTYFGQNIFYFLRHHKIPSIILLISPFYPPFHIAMVQISEFEHFPIDITFGFLIGGFIAFVSFCTFKHELLSECTIADLSETLSLMDITSEIILKSLWNWKWSENHKLSSNEKKKIQINHLKQNQNPNPIKIIQEISKKAQRMPLQIEMMNMEGYSQ